MACLGKAKAVTWNNIATNTYNNNDNKNNNNNNDNNNNNNNIPIHNLPSLSPFQSQLVNILNAD